MVWLCGPPWWPGNTEKLTRSSKSYSVSTAAGGRRHGGEGKASATTANTSRYQQAVAGPGALTGAGTYCCRPCPCPSRPCGRRSSRRAGLAETCAAREHAAEAQTHTGGKVGARNRQAMCQTSRRPPPLRRTFPHQTRYHASRLKHVVRETTPPIPSSS